MRNSRVALLVLALVSVVASLAALLLVAHRRAPQPAAPGAAGAVAVLHDWDAQRASAWALGDEPALARLYVPGSAAGRRDRALLRAYRARGLVVRGMRRQVLSVRVVGSDRDRWVLEVTDRLVGAVAVGPGVRVRLPQGAARSRRIVFERSAGLWQVASVRPAPAS